MARFLHVKYRQKGMTNKVLHGFIKLEKLVKRKTEAKERKPSHNLRFGASWKSEIVNKYYSFTEGLSRLRQAALTLYATLRTVQC